MTTQRPWHIGPIPIPKPSTEPTDAEVAEMVTAASERHLRRMRGAR
jgi:hypothetical protein